MISLTRNKVVCLALVTESVVEVVWTEIITRKEGTIRLKQTTRKKLRITVSKAANGVLGNEVVDERSVVKVID